jgi:hypothetical protein
LPGAFDLLPGGCDSALLPCGCRRASDGLLPERVAYGVLPGKVAVLPRGLHGTLLPSRRGRKLFLMLPDRLVTTLLPLRLAMLPAEPSGYERKTLLPARNKVHNNPGRLCLPLSRQQSWEDGRYW